jgi:hypothetical protein
MSVIFWDAETYYDKEYSLRKMTPAQYILDDRFELICAAAQVDNGPIEDIDGPDFAKWLAQFDPAQTTMVAYNSLFDQCIAAWRYRFVPARMIDMLGVSRALLAYKLRRLSLESVAKHLELGDKGDTIQTVLGMRRVDIQNAGLWLNFLEYNRHDVRLLRGIFDKLMPQFPPSEIKVQDLVLRCTVEPRFVMNIPKLTAHLENVRAAKEALLQGASVEKPQLMSATQFAALLEAEGVEIETKVSNTGNTIPALAKSDQFMVDLLEHENPRVQSLAAARIGLKSTLEESRTERLLAIAGLPWPT